jgi:two-component system nitrogen regulation sensor histidine kinase NtrY
LLIVGGGVLTVLTYLLLYSHKAEEQIAIEVEEKIERKMEGVNDIMSSATSFTQFPSQSGAAFFLYDSLGKVLRWNDNSFVPSLDQFNINGERVLLSVDEGEFLYLIRKIDWPDVRSGYLVGMVSIRRSFGLRNDLLHDVYNHELIPGNIEITPDSNSIPVRYQNETLFYFKCTGASYFDSKINLLITVLICALVLIIVLIAYRVALWTQPKVGFVKAMFILGVQLLVLRLFILYVELPTSFSKLAVFEPDIFSEGWFYYTLGDGLINLLLANLMLFYFILHRPRKLLLIKKRGVAIGLTLLSYLLIYWFSVTTRFLHQKSNFSLDISTSLDFSVERVVAFLVIGLMTGLYFLIHYLAYGFADRSRARPLWVDQLIIMVAMLILAVLFEKPWLLVLVNGAYLLCIHFFKMPQSLTSLKFGSVNYLIFTCIVLAVVGSIVIYKSQERTDRYAMQRFISYLQVERDIEGEYLLSEIVNQIYADKSLREVFKEGKTDSQLVGQQVRRSYLSNYFNDYEIEIHFFNELGRGLSGKFRGASVHFLKESYNSGIYRTAYPDIYYDGQIDINKRKKYLCFIHFSENDKDYGHMVIELTLKKFSSRRVLPQLLVERRVFQKDAFAYAYLIEGHFNYTSGDFQYESAFDMTWLDLPNLYTTGIERAGYQHLGARLGDRITLVSQPEYPTKSIIANFSFLFIVQVLLFSIVALLFIGRSSLGDDLYFSTKIMLYSVASFVLPLILVTIAVLSTTDQSNRKEIDNSNRKRTALLAENFDGVLAAYKFKKTDINDLANEVNKLSSYSGMDVNLYNAKGTLLASSTPEIFDRKILTKYLNPDAYETIVEHRKESLIAEESVGEFKYKTSYIAINSPDTGELLGVLASPYFASKNHVARQQLQVFENIINIFTFIFIFSIAVAYWVISRLTRPIAQIAAKLHETGFVNTNQPIEWKADDEIGKLVREYNNMLSKLEETKVELARNEKEAAWREMAKQVAHEIKNPLTPMKLTIQHLSRIFKEKGEDKKSLEILLGQIDTLDEIVTSFSHFAKMPVPLNEPFDIRQTLKKSIELHVDKKITVQIEDKPCIVNGDQKLFGRIFNNLILNGFEAMKFMQNPEFHVSLETKQNEVLLSFRDNGEGIDKKIYDKVFIPNFSTKAAGSGIGLAVAKRGIEHAGGRIWFESEEGQGTTFFIKLSLYRPTQN